MVDLNAALIDLAYGIALVGCGVLLVYKYLPQVWEKMFPTSQQKIEAKIILLEDDNAKLTAEKESLTKLKEERNKHQTLAQTVSDLKKELDQK